MQAAGGQQLKECDLVMKGGITSGVVYPMAIKRLAHVYRFRSLGGASAGAMAAVVAAACEYSRRRGDHRAFDRLDAVAEDLQKRGFVRRLFQPVPEARPAFELALDLVGRRDTPRAQVAAVLKAVLRERSTYFRIALIGMLVIAFGAVGGIMGLAEDGTSGVEVGVSLLLMALLLTAALLLFLFVVLGALVSFAASSKRALESNHHGMCHGSTEVGQEPSGLTDWLHHTIQDCAGLTLAEPLTFAMLKWPHDGPPPHDAAGPEVSLQLVTTDLSYSRPVDLPLSAQPTKVGKPQYYFKEAEMLRLFPPEVVEAMKGSSQPAFAEEEAGIYPMPGDDLPIVVAARLSLAFPLLLSAVPLRSKHPERPGLVEHEMSDGGISSNFPIHFFDALFPSRPTFGLELQPCPDRGEEKASTGPEPYIVFGNDVRPPNFSRTGTLFTFGHQIFDAARNWRDSMQSELPGYRDRICQIRLTKSEGGLNLDMKPEVIQKLLIRGQEAAEAILATHPGGPRFDWDRHRWVRYLTLMEVLELNLGNARPHVLQFLKQFHEIRPEWGYQDARSASWWRMTSPAVNRFFRAVNWGKPGQVAFTEGTPVPQPVLRIVPKA